MDQIKTGVIGVGKMGEYHVGVLSELREVDLTVISDTDAARGQTISERYGVPYVKDYKEALKQMDAAIIAVPTGLHYALGKEVLNAGIHVLMEKPCSDNLAHARDPNVLMQSHHSRNERVVFHNNMSGQSRVIHDHHMIAHFTIMRHMGIGHQQTMPAHHGGAILFGRPVNGDVFPNSGVVTDTNGRGHILEIHDLRFAADEGPLKKPAIFTDGGSRLDHYMRSDFRPLAYRDAATQNTEGTDGNMVSQIHTGMNDGVICDAHGTNRYLVFERWWFFTGTR